MKRILFVFLDGVGLGPRSSDNPLSSSDGAPLHSALTSLTGGQTWTADLKAISTASHLVRPIDATLGVDGLPQSGTGQASLLTGVNCAKQVGRHFGPFPHSATHDTLGSESIFHKVESVCGRDASAFANAYPPRFFDFAQGRGRWTVTTRACVQSDVKVRGIDDLQNGRAITADLTGAAWRDQLDLDVNVCSEADAGQRLVDLTDDYAFTLYEYFLTDKVGHGRVDLSPHSLLDRLGRFFAAITDHANPDALSLVVTSDHGNLEDLSVKTHTRNPVPLIVTGWSAPYFCDASDLTDVTPAIVRALKEERSR